MRGEFFGSRSSGVAEGKKIRILIGDGRPIFRAGLRKLLAKEPDLTVAGEAADGRQVLLRVKALKPHILLLEAPLAGGTQNDFAVLRELQQKHKNTQVIVLASSEKDEESLKAMQRLLAGIVPKHASFSLLLRWLRGAQAGEAWLNLPTAATAGPLASRPLPDSRSKAPLLLSVRERQVMGLIAQGFKNKEVAARMFISEQTVKNHLHNIFDKLGVSDRLELALYAIHKNLQAPS